MKKILVTGSEGFIGSHLTERLINDGFKVRSFVQYNSFNNWGWLDTFDAKTKSKLDVYLGDIRDINSLTDAMKDCCCVLHLAALIAIPFSYISPDTYIDTNIKGTTNVLQAAKILKIKKIIHTSTSEVYGTAKYVPIDEVHPLQGQSPYSATKIGADQIALSFFRSFDTPVTIIRPFNTYGPRQSARAIIPTIITQALNGGSIKLGSLVPTRDFNYVTDIVDGFVKAMLCKKNIEGEVINLGTNYEISIKDTVNEILSILKIDKKFLTQDKLRLRPKKSEVDRLLCDNSKAKKILKWQPKFNNIHGFRKGLQQTIRWFSEAENLKKYKSQFYNL